MTVRPLNPSEMIPPEARDVPLDGKPSPAAAAADGSSFAESLARAFGAAGGGLERAAQAERAFAAGRGGLQEMVIERAQADVTLAIASAAASRAAQSLSTILGMQV